ncbi:hypothetical protein SSCG_00876 [Streptomyces clavuligerus]|nr:hypothetical protein SSCG_00876 [Streptomyces clavuligerus]
MIGDRRCGGGDAGAGRGARALGARRSGPPGAGYCQLMSYGAICQLMSFVVNEG